MSEFSRETLLNIIETDHVQCGEASALARMAMAAMDSSESVELPLDYLQGHKDGLEWAAQLAEANHPETGDWLYDDPIELAKAIRKGPDMPPAQPVADSEPVAWLLSGGGAKNVVCFDSGNAYADPLREVTPLYRHAQPAPVVQCPFPCGWDNLNKLAIQDAAFVACGLVEGEMVTESHRQAVISNNDRLLKVISACRSAMQPAPVVPDGLLSMAASAIEDLLEHTDPNTSYYSGVWADVPGKLRAAMLQAGNSPVIPDGWVMVPKEPTEAMMLHNSGCQHHAWDDPDCAMRQTRRLIWSHMLAAAQQEVQGE